MPTVFVWLVACASESIFGLDSAAPPETATTNGDTSSATPADPEPEYFSFEAEFVLDDLGAWSKPAIVTVTQYDVVPGTQLDERVELCSVAVPVVTTPDVAPVEGMPVWSWWRVQLDASAETADCPAWPAQRWWLGVGGYDARLDPAVYAAQLQGTELYGLYLMAEGAPLYVVGVAGTPAMYGGEPGLAVSPLVAGNYLARSLVLLSMP